MARHLRSSSSDGNSSRLVAKINGEVRKIFADPTVQKTFLDPQYFESIAGSPQELSERIRTEEPQWRKLIGTAHITVE